MLAQEAAVHTVGQQCTHLTRVVDEDVHPLEAGEDHAAELLDREAVPKVQAYHMEPVLPRPGNDTPQAECQSA